MINYYIIGLLVLMILVIIFYILKKRKLSKENTKNAIVSNETFYKGVEIDGVSFCMSSKSIFIKRDWKSIEEILIRNKINFLYHFTDKENLNSILVNQGLYSWDYCGRNNIKILKPGGNDTSRNLDSRKQLQNYVRLCFVESHPMMYIAIRDQRIRNPIVLKISPEVLFWQHTKFSDINAATERINPKIGEDLEHFKNINFGIFEKNYLDLDYLGKMYYQAEVLVLEKIPINYIMNIDDFRRE